MDRLGTTERSRNMAAVRSRGNATTEMALVRIFRKEKITGWRRHKKIFGIRPDFVFHNKKIAVFVHGCFWHGCKKHRTIPKTNKVFWKKKISANKRRDSKSCTILRTKGWAVVRVWEHEIRNNPNELTAKLDIILS
jgi:DNA mismatch endonuclease (patch repair protein)